jgi:PBP1b-binding outer membrane lipoprotein LpoB
MRLALILIILILIAGCGSDDVGVNETNTTQQPVEVVTEEQEDVIEEENAEVKEPGINLKNRT